MTERKSLKSLRLFLSALSLAAFMALCPVNVAAESYEEMYGPELKSIPYAYRARYSNEYGKPWSEATYDDRLRFLQMLQQEEFEALLASENLDNQEALLENHKIMVREAEKIAEQQEEFAKLLRKNDEKYREEMKKNEVQIKSMNQRIKIMNMRNQQ